MDIGHGDGSTLLWGFANGKIITQEGETEDDSHAMFKELKGCRAWGRVDGESGKVSLAWWNLPRRQVDYIKKMVEKKWPHLEVVEFPPTKNTRGGCRAGRECG